VLAMPDFREKLVKLGIEPDSGKTPAEVGAFIRGEADKFAKIVHERGIKAE